MPRSSLIHRGDYRSRWTGFWGKVSGPETHLSTGTGLGTSAVDEIRKLYVGNLPFSVTANDLLQIASRIAPGCIANVIADRFSGRSKGFGYITAPTLAASESLIERLHGKTLEERELNCTWAAPRDVEGLDASAEGDDGSAAIIQAMSDFSHELARAIGRNPRRLAYIEWRDLERTLAAVFEELGFQVELTPPSKDRGRDLILQCTLSGQHRKYLVEAKHWRSGKHVGPDPVRSFIGVVARETRDGGLMLSTSGYSKRALEVLTEYKKVRVVLGGREKIAALCQTYVRASGHVWSPPQDLADVLFDDAERPDGGGRGYVLGKAAVGLVVDAFQPDVRPDRRIT